MEGVLKDVYLNPNSPAFLAGINAVHREAKKHLPGLKQKDVEKFLHRQNVYSLHKPPKRRFPRNRMVPVGLDSHWAGDLMDMRNLKQHNRGYTYAFTCVDMLSKYGWCVPIKDKKPETVAKAFEYIVQTYSRKPWYLMTDKGTEFVGKPFQDMMKKYDVQFYTAPSPDVKAAPAERLIKTIKTRLWKYFTLNKTFNYVDIIDEIMKAYNNSVSSVTKHKPSEVNPSNENEVFRIAFGGEKKSKTKFKYKIGDFVRITKERGAFAKGYLPNYTEEVFVVRERLERNPPAYRLQAMDGDPISGLFYHAELSSTRKPI